MKDFALAVTVHDPEGRILVNSKYLPIISKLYLVMVAAVTKATAPKTVKLLKHYGFKILPSPDNEIGSSRRNAIRETLANGEVSWVHYADLDRLLHWAKSYPKELQKIVSCPPQNDYVAIGRTKRAWQTHPKIMIEMEKLENNQAKNFFNLKAADFTAGSCLISAKAALVILKYSVQLTNATDLEWPAIVAHYMGTFPSCVLTEGMEFETADYYKEDIQRAGSLDNWIRSVYDNPGQISARQILADDSINAAKRVLSTL